jgi:tRNA pseudouridine55 synthase
MDFNFSKEDLQEGLILAFDKPYKWTSFDLVNKVRKLLCRYYDFKKLKVGHAGTLDPLATGLLLLCIGKATKKIQDIQSFHKEYEAEITLGATTPSFDLETKIDKTYSINHIDDILIKESIKKFIGKIDQIPPLYSAKFVDGTRAYELARSGIQMELKPSQIEIFNLEIIDFNNPIIKLKINCSKGTYIRSLARDLGNELNSGAYLSALRRTGIGAYSVNNALNVEYFIKTLNVL